jgi:hypothetical protein
MSEDTKKSSAAMILLAWVLVSVPLGWGVYNTLLNSMKLFRPRLRRLPVRRQQNSRRRRAAN